MVNAIDSICVPLTEAAKFFPPRNGKHPHIRTLCRRILVGCRGVKLQAVSDGHQWYTSREWVDAYLANQATKAISDQESTGMHGAKSLSTEISRSQLSHPAAIERLKRRYGLNVGARDATNGTGSE